MSIKIQLKHSSVQDKAPQPTDLADGELALNVNANSPAAYIKDSAGAIVKLAGVGSVGASDRVAKAGDTMTGDLILNDGATDNITLSTDGSASFAGNVEVAGIIAPAAQLGNAPNQVAVNIGNGSTQQMQFLTDGSARFGGILPGTPNALINGADGSATFAGTVTAVVVPPSDAKFKENITDASPQLADVVALGSQLKNFDWNADAPVNDEIRAQRQLGLIAQEAEKVCPSLVKTIKRTKQGKELTPEQVIPAVYEDRQDPEDEENWIQVEVTPEQTIPATYEELDDSYKGISHDALIMKLLGAIAELKAEVDALKTA